jgi:molybdate transport system substrate-binding protein
LEQIKSKLVYAKDVRQVLTYVESENVDAGLVYITDAKSSNQVKVAATASPGAHTPIVYPVGVVRNTKQVNAAKNFVQFLSSNPAKAVFTKYGFGIAKK